MVMEYLDGETLGARLERFTAPRAAARSAPSLASC